MAFTPIVSLPILVGALLLFLDPLPATLMLFTSFTPTFVPREISIEVNSARLWMAISFMTPLIFFPKFSLFLFDEYPFSMTLILPCSILILVLPYLIGLETRTLHLLTPLFLLCLTS
ncbi:hypothetical protein LINPERPRIM_LOCUS35182 [Linum perenne]